MCDTIQTRFHHFPQLITTSILSLFPLPYIISPPYNSPSQYAQNSFIPNLCRTCLPIPFPSPNPSTFSFFFFLIIRPPPTSPLFPSPPLFRSQVPALLPRRELILEVHPGGSGVDHFLHDLEGV